MAAENHLRSLLSNLGHLGMVFDLRHWYPGRVDCVGNMGLDLDLYMEADLDLDKDTRFDPDAEGPGTRDLGKGFRSCRQ